MATTPPDALLASPAAVRSHPAAAGLPDFRLVQLLRAGSQKFRTDSGQTISFVEDDAILLDPEGSGTLLLPQLPVEKVTSIVVDGIPIDPTGLWSEKGIIRRAVGRFPRSFRSVAVVYSHGYREIPSDVQEAVVDYVLSRGLSTPGQPAGQLQAGPFMVQQSGGGATELWSETVKRYAVRA